MTQKLELAVVLPEGGSLRLWEESGVFDRQVALYRYWQEAGLQISLVSFGGREEYDYKPLLPGMKILPNWIGLPDGLYRKRIHQVLGPRLLGAQLLRTSDAAATNPALKIAWAWRIPLIYRLGYVASKFARALDASDETHYRRLAGRERKALEAACHVIAATDEIADDLKQMLPEAADKLTVIPNHVDTEHFRPQAGANDYDLVYVGRFAKQKNLFALLEAVERLGMTIAMIGGAPGDETAALQERFGDLDGQILWLGRIKNDELPKYIQGAKAFVLPSLIEGHPRVMIEAMACGMPIVGADVPGIRNVLRHEVTGYLCGTDPASIAEAIAALFVQPELMRKLGADARKYAVENYSLPQLAQRELNLLGEIAQRQPRESAPARLSHYLLRRRA